MQNKKISKKILLIRAIVKNRHKFCTPPLGIMSIASIARERCGWDVRILDTYLLDDPEKEVLDLMESWTPDVVGLSSLTIELKSMHHLAGIVRKAVPEVIILAGGVHPSQYTAETLKDLSIDAAVISEGEITAEQILNCIAKGESWREVKGIAVRDENGEVLKREPQPFINDLDSIPFPAWDLVDISAYAEIRGMSTSHRRYMAIMTSRACPYNCTFCHEMFGKTFRTHSPEYVLKMINILVEKYNIFNFDIVDDIFNFDAKRMEKILDTLIEKGPSIRFAFPNGIRADILTEEQIDKLCRAGCEYVCLAVETASPRLQKKIKKNIKIDKVMVAIESFARRKVFTAGYFMTGFPSETEEEMRLTYDYANRSSLHMAYFFTVIPFEGTELYSEAKDSMNSDAHDINNVDYFYRTSNLSEVPEKRFLRLKAINHLRFYFNVNRFYRICRDLPRLNVLWFTLKWIVFIPFFLTLDSFKLKKPQSSATGKT